MIKCFIYDLSEKNQKMIIGLVESDSVTENTGDIFPMYQRDSYVLKENERFISNAGEHYYIVFDVDSRRKYLDVNIFRDGVKVGLNNDISYAACQSHDFFEAILNHFDYFMIDDVTEIDSLNGISKKGQTTDYFGNVFRRVNADSFCEIIKGDKVYFVGLDENRNYCLVDDFYNAIKIAKGKMRRVLLINNLVDKTVDKYGLSFSPFNCFCNGSSYLFNWPSGFIINYDGTKLTITKNAKITKDYHLVNSEEKALTLKNIYKAFKEEVISESYFVKYNNQYLYNDGLEFSIVNDSKDSNMISDYKLNIFKMAISLFVGEANYQTFNNASYLISYDNLIKLSDSFDNEGTNKIVDVTLSNSFKKNVLMADKLNEGVIIICNNKYLCLNIIDNSSFTINYEDCAYNATIFSEQGAKCTINLLGLKSLKKEIKNNLDITKFNIQYGDVDFNLGDNYKIIMDKLVEGKHRIWNYESIDEIKLETEKGSLEYLRLFYPKGVMDSKALFEMTIDNNINNILIINNGLNIDLIGLNNATKNLNRQINVATIDTIKCGYYPKVELNHNLKYIASYRCNFDDLPSCVLNKFDLILFTRHFDSSVNNLKHIKEKMVVNVRNCGLNKVCDKVFDYYSQDEKISRKLFSNYDNFDDVIKINESGVKRLQDICKSNGIDVLKPLLDRKYSYVTISKDSKDFLKNK